jgi:hypothetical protein
LHSLQFATLSWHGRQAKIIRKVLNNMILLIYLL